MVFGNRPLTLKGGDWWKNPRRLAERNLTALVEALSEKLANYFANQDGETAASKPGAASYRYLAENIVKAMIALLCQGAQDSQGPSLREVYSREEIERLAQKVFRKPYKKGQPPVKEGDQSGVTRCLVELFVERERFSEDSYFEFKGDWYRIKRQADGLIVQID